MLLKLSNISKSYGTHLVFKDVNFSIETGQRMCVVGPNGAGKSTLLKIIAGLENSDTGKVQFAKGVKWAYVPQDTKHIDGSISGGQKTKLLLEKALATNPDLLILDEPTNNLDFKNLDWLEDVILSKKLAYIVVSHDRVFLDKTVNRILEIDPVSHTVRFSNGKYSDYLEKRKKDKERQADTYEEQQNKIKITQESIRQQKIKSEKGSKWKPDDNDKYLKGFKRDRAAGSARAAKRLEKRLEMMEKVEKPTKSKKLKIDIKNNKTSGDKTIKLADLMVGYKKSSFVLGPINMSIGFGNRVAIIGENGTGKSTLIKTLCGYLPPIRGVVEIGGGVRFGNLMQEHDNMKSNNEVIEFVMGETGLEELEIYPLLVKYNLDIRSIRGKCGELSPGQRARVIVAIMQSNRVNTLILDEPTNHLDIDAMNALYELIGDFKGTIISVTHDRYFLQIFKPDDIYEVSSKGVKRINYK